MRGHLLLLLVLSTTLANVRQLAEPNRISVSKRRMIREIEGLANKQHKQAAVCQMCRLLLNSLNQMVDQNKTDEEIMNFHIQLCDGINLEQPRDCKNTVRTFASALLFVFEKTAISADEICAALFDDCGRSELSSTAMWNVSIPDGKPPVQEWPRIPDNKPTYKVLHLSDFHIDRQYAVGSEASCEYDDSLGKFALCCRFYDDDFPSSETKTKAIKVPAGPWGMPYSCDLPYQTFEEALKHISTTHTDLSYIMLTGDFEAHDPWDYTRDRTRKSIENITDALLKYFPKTPIYVSIGNHEGVPQDAMAPHTMPEYDQRGPQWIYTIMKNMSSNWLPQSSLADVQYRASYVVYPKPGLKLISVNSVYCSKFNFYLYLNQTDPDGTLQWLIDELLDSERKGEKVHIISHIPPGDHHCLKGWSFNFFNIVKRFENTIAEQFYGHTHNDHFQVYYDSSDNMRPFHFNWISPSLTTYDFNNPSYRIYVIDGDYPEATYTVKDAETYYANVTEANANNKPPIWRLEYSTRQFYNMTDLSPQSWSDLSDRLWKDTDLFRQFVKHFYRNDHNSECYNDIACRRSFVCAMKQARSHDKSFCASLQQVDE